MLMLKDEELVLFGVCFVYTFKTNFCTNNKILKKMPKNIILSMQTCNDSS